jgi:thiol-disulfide isomerase/thioredoxin
MEVGKARIEGKILAYRPGMPDEVSVYVAYPFTHPYANEIKLPVDKKGAFSGEIDVFSTHPALVFWTGDPVRCYLAAGEKTTLILNPFAAHQKDSPSAYIGGYLAPLSKELAQIDKVFTVDNHLRAYEEFLESIANDTPESLKAFFLKEYREKVAELDTLQASPAAKQVFRCKVDMVYAFNVIATPIMVERATQYNEQKRDPQAKPQAPKAEPQPLSEDFYDDLRDFPLLNDPTLFYLSDFGNYADQLHQGKVQPILSQALGTDQGPLFDAIRTADAYASIEDFAPLDAAQLEQLPAAYRAFIQEKNDELLEKIKANESKTGYTFHDIKDLAPDAVFPSILAKYKGKPILIDFWATWCGPCRVANEELKPVKKELAAANTDLVYVFLAGENSPEGVWNNMITDLHGEHFRLTEAQWNYFGEHFNLHAVPTYFFIDRKGNIQAKETGYPGLEQMKQRIYKLIE